MLYWRNTFIVGTKMFSRWKLQIKTEQRKFSINPFEKNQEAGIGSFFEIKKKKLLQWEKWDWRHSDQMTKANGQTIIGGGRVAD